MEVQTYQQVAYWAGIFLGSLIIVSICFVYIKEKEIQRNSIIFGFVGTILVGMSIWTSISFKVSGDGIDVSFLRNTIQSIEKEQKEMDKDIEIIETERKELLSSVASLKGSVRLYEGRPIPRNVIQNFNRQFESMNRRNKNIMKRITRVRKRTKINRQKISAIKENLNK